MGCLIRIDAIHIRGPRFFTPIFFHLVCNINVPILSCRVPGMQALATKVFFSHYIHGTTSITLPPHSPFPADLSELFRLNLTIQTLYHF